VKSNIGHLEGTSGLAGVIKALLALERAVIPPNTNFEKLNPQIDAEFFNLRFPTECVPWPKADEIRRASVNSFGFGGSNAHIVLEAADGYLKNLGHKKPHFFPFSVLQKKAHVHESTITNGAQPTNFVHKINHHREKPNDCVEYLSNGSPKKASHPRLLILSASDEGGIARQPKNLSQSLPTACPLGKDEDKEILDDIVFTLNSRRTMLEWKSYGILESLSGFSNLQHSLSSPVRNIGTVTPHLGLVFTGQGAQWARMGYELLDWPLFKASMMQSQKYLDMMGCKWRLIGKSILCNSLNL
jgi:acyl transferase domain-containing protein